MQYTLFQKLLFCLLPDFHVEKLLQLTWRSRRMSFQHLRYPELFILREHSNFSGLNRLMILF